MMRARPRLFRRASHCLASAMLALLAMLAPVAAGQQAPDSGDPLPQYLGGDSGEFQRVHGPRPFVFPTDHGPHPDYRHEWWYFTGNLFTSGQRHFGFELTVFRFGLAPGEPARESRLATHHVHMAHLALTDTERASFIHFERFARPVLGIAGARAEPFRVWLEDWVVEADPDRGHPDCEGCLALRLHAADGDIELDLALESLKPAVLQGHDGYSPKSATPGNASHYYSLTRLATEGSIRTAEGEFAVEGTSWLDREWGSSVLDDDQAGWDWFALQFDDGRELMYYRMRRDDGTTDPASAGVLVDADGDTVRLAADDVSLTALAHWQSPTTGARYPVRWQVVAPAIGLDVEIEPRLEHQEMDTVVRYWEGAVTAGGQLGNETASAVGYVELTGYGSAP